MFFHVVIILISVLAIGAMIFGAPSLSLFELIDSLFYHGLPSRRR